MTPKKMQLGGPGGVTMEQLATFGVQTLDFRMEKEGGGELAPGLYAVIDFVSNVELWSIFLSADRAGTATLDVRKWVDPLREAESIFPTWKPILRDAQKSSYPKLPEVHTAIRAGDSLNFYVEEAIGLEWIDVKIIYRRGDAPAGARGIAL